MRARITQYVACALTLCGNEVEAQRGQRRAFARRRNDSTAVTNASLELFGSRSARPVRSSARTMTGAYACALSDADSSPRKSAAVARVSPQPGQGTPVNAFSGHSQPGRPAATSAACAPAAAQTAQAKPLSRHKAERTGGNGGKAVIRLLGRSTLLPAAEDSGAGHGTSVKRGAEYYRL